MALINLQTNLKSLRYGHDRPGGGDSGQPFSYVAPNIPNIEFNYNQNISASYTPNVGANFFDIPEVTFASPFGKDTSTPGTIGASLASSGIKFTTLFNGNGADVATPIIKALDAAAGFVTNGVIGIANQGINFINNTFDTTRSSNYPDFLWRTNRFAIGHAYQDMQRLTKFMLTPSGIFFVVKQELLERQNVKMEGTTRLYNPLGTIAQAGVNWIGYHLNKQGLNPLERSYAKGGNNGYYLNTKNSIGSLGVRNRLNSIGQGANRLTTLMLNKINHTATGFDQYGITGVENRDTLIRYNGGPGAPLGIGFTRISLTDPTREVQLRKDKTFFFNYNIDDIDNINYLTPEFLSIGPSVAWYYDPFNNTDTLGYRSVYSKSILKLKPNNINFSKFAEQYFGDFKTILNRDIKTISSSLYAPATSSATIGRKGTDPTKPEFYTPTGNIKVEWVYQAKKGTAQNYYNLVKDEISETNKLAYFDNIFIGGVPGENKNNINTRIFDNKNNVNKDLFTLNGTQIANKTSLGKQQDTSFGDTSITDFRSGSFQNDKKEPLTVSTNYSIFNRDTTYGASKTSFKGNWLNDLKGAILQNQRILDPNTSISSDEVEAEDIVRLNFTIASPSNSSNITFRAYLETWSDGFKGEWSPIKYMGRAESFYKYNGFSRDSSITFLVPTLSRGDLSSNYTKLNELINSVVPSYSTNSGGVTPGLMRGSITYITMGDYFSLVPSIVRSVDFSEIEGMGWDIDRNVDGSRTGQNLQLPKGIKVTISFTPVHNFTPQFGETFIG